jgi:hypothetical protein
MRPLIYGLLATTAFIPGAFAESKCAFNKNATTKFEHKIEKSEVVKRVILDLDKEKELQACRIVVKGTIDGKIFEEPGMFSFGPEMSRNEACEHAEDRAKERLLSLNSPQVFNGQTSMKCGQHQNVGPKIAAQPVPKVTIEPIGPQKKKETVTIEPLQKESIRQNYTITHMPERVRRHIVRKNTGNWPHPLDGRMRYANVGPVASCHKVYKPVFIDGYRVQAYKEVCNER